MQSKFLTAHRYKVGGDGTKVVEDGQIAIEKPLTLRCKRPIPAAA